MLYGDSLTEMWRGRRGSKPDKTRERLPGDNLQWCIANMLMLMYLITTCFHQL